MSRLSIAPTQLLPGNRSLMPPTDSELPIVVDSIEMGASIKQQAVMEFEYTLTPFKKMLSVVES